MRPMLATPADPSIGLPPDGRAWAYEVKWDGMRVLADLHDGRLRLTSRSGRDITAAFPELAPLAQSHPDALLDGEVIVLAGGTPSFAALADRIHVTDPRRARTLAARSPATLIVFDVLRLYGVDLTARSWQDRRDALERLAPSGATWQVSPTYDDLHDLLEATLEQGLEGVLAKRRSSRYCPGVRSADWLKLAHQRLQSCVVGGWRPETNTTGRVGALLLGVWDGGLHEQAGAGVAGVAGAADRAGCAAGVAGTADRADGAVTGQPPRLRFSGRVGSGIGAAAQLTLTRLLADLRIDSSPFDTPVPREDATGTVWVRPQVVVEVRYLNRTDGGRLRNPVFRGVRADVDPSDARDE